MEKDYDQEGNIVKLRFSSWGDANVFLTWWLDCGGEGQFYEDMADKLDDIDE